MMRILFLILLLANVVVFFLFRGAVQAPQAQYVPQPLPAAKPLRLLSELSPDQLKALAKSNAAAQTQINTPAPAPVVPASSTVSNAAVATPAAPLVCASYGPFPGEDAAKTGRARLQHAGAQVSQRLVPGKVRLGYWVYLPPFRNRKQAEAAEKLLRKRGIKDLFIVSDEAKRNAISLGVYSQRSGAVERRKQMRKLGYFPVLADRFRDTPNYWLDAQGTADQLPAAKTFDDLAEGDVHIKRSEISCSGNGGN